jgi:hypothetical protein
MNMDDWQLDIDTPLKAIERIAQSEDRMLAIQFFLFFSRFEYALKCLGKIKPSKNSNLPSANWDGYAKAREPVWLKAKENAEFNEALAFMDAKPPKQQVFSDGELKWVENSRSGEPASLGKTFSYVRTVRNNLFHGSKLDSVKGKEMSRDRELIKHCLTILAVCLEGDRQLRAKFLEGLD